MKSNAKTNIDNDCWTLDNNFCIQSGWTCLTYGNLCCPKWKPRQIVDDDQIVIFKWWCSTLWRIKSRSKHNSKLEEHRSSEVTLLSKNPDLQVGDSPATLPWEFAIGNWEREVSVSFLSSISYQPKEVQILPQFKSDSL